MASMHLCLLTALSLLLPPWDDRRWSRKTTTKKDVNLELCRNISLYTFNHVPGLPHHPYSVHLKCKDSPASLLIHFSGKLWNTTLLLHSFSTFRPSTTGHLGSLTLRREKVCCSRASQWNGWMSEDGGQNRDDKEGPGIWEGLAACNSKVIAVAYFQHSISNRLAFTPTCLSCHKPENCSTVYLYYKNCKNLPYI